MSNRQQRRAAAKRGKRQGETYADVLAKKRMIKEAVEQSVHDNAVALESDIKSQRLLWIAVVALNETFGFGGERARRFLQSLEDVAGEVEALAKENGAEYALAKLMERAGKITQMEITPIHEEEMRLARIQNQKEGIFFEADDPDKW